VCESVIYFYVHVTEVYIFVCICVWVCDCGYLCACVPRVSVCECVIYMGMYICMYVYCERVSISCVYVPWVCTCVIVLIPPSLCMVACYNDYRLVRAIRTR